MTGTDNCRKNSFKTPATTCTVYSSKLTWSIPESARDNAGKKKNTINRRWWKQGWDQVCLDTVLFPCSLRKQPTFRDAATGFPAKWVQKFHNDDVSLPRFWLVVLRDKFASTNQKHCPDQGSDTSSVWNFCTPFSFSRRNQWWLFSRGILRVAVRFTVVFVT